MSLNSATLLAGGIWLAIFVTYGACRLHDWWEKRR